MTHTETERIQAGEPAATVCPRSDLSFDVDADGRVLTVHRIGDSVRMSDHEDVIRELRHVEPAAQGELAALRKAADAVLSAVDDGELRSALDRLSRAREMQPVEAEERGPHDDAGTGLLAWTRR